MKYQILKFVASAITALSMAACDNEKNADPSSPFDGIWLKNNCNLLGTAGGKNVYGNQVYLTIENTSSSNVSRAWVDDASCTANAEAWVETMTFTTSLSSSSLGSDIYNFDSTLSGGTWEIKTADGATVLNTVSQCGQTDWAAGQTYNQNDRGCFASMPIGTVFYNIGQISGTTLTLGDNPGTTEGARPGSLGTEEIYQKQ